MTKSDASRNTKGDWYPHKWILEADASGMQRMNLKLTDLTFGDDVLAKDTNVVLATTSKFVIQIGSKFKAQADAFE